MFLDSRLSDLACQRSRIGQNLAALFFAGNGPPGFEAMRRDRRGHWDWQADIRLQVVEPTPHGRYAAILTAQVSERERAVARKKAEAIIEGAKRRVLGVGDLELAGLCIEVVLGGVVVRYRSGCQVTSR
jgi:hypothetical protein